MALLWILILMVGLSKRAAGEYECTMQSFEVNCTGINPNHLSQKISATLNKNEVASLNVTNGIIPIVMEDTFKDFTDLHSLYVTNCKVLDIKDNAFTHSSNLNYLYLNNNSLTKFNIRSLSKDNNLKVLDLSYNLLNDLSNFNISFFSKLTVLSLTNNFLTYLPFDLLTKLEEDNEFYLIADNNPWNCSDLNWSKYLTPNLTEAFCINKTFDYKPEVEEERRNENSENTTIEIAKENEKELLEHLENVNDDNENHTNKDDQKYEGKPEDNQHGFNQTCPKLNCAKCSFYYCLSWSLCGIWVGIIIGNVGKLMNLVCKKPIQYNDQYTQCEYSLSEKYIVSGYHLDFSRRKSQQNSQSKSSDAAQPFQYSTPKNSDGFQGAPSSQPKRSDTPHHVSYSDSTDSTKASPIFMSKSMEKTQNH